MELKNIIANAIYFEFASKLDDLILDILYNPQDGYLNLYSKEAIIQSSNKIKYFDETAYKLQNEINLNNAEDLIKTKREDLIFAIKKHCQKQIYAWCDEIYQDCIENCKTLIAMNKNDKHIANKIFKEAISLINWFSDLKKLNSKEQENLINNFNNELNEIMKLDINEINKTVQKTNENCFFELFENIKDEEFLKLNLENYRENLTKEDLDYFKQIQINLNTCKANPIKDEIELIKASLKIMNFQNKKEQYKFVKDIINDFTFNKLQNNKLSEEDKANLIKKRMLIFKDKTNYFKNLIKI